MPISLRLDPTLSKSLDEAVKTTKLNKSDLARLAIERGLNIVVAQLTTMPSAAA